MMTVNTPYLPAATIYEEVLTADNRLTDPWKNHMDAISESLGYVVVQDRFADTKQETPLTAILSMPQARRDQLENAINGAIIYNTDTNRFNFRENGAWVTFTPIPA